MPVVRVHDAEVHHVHGSAFLSFVNTARGGGGLCAWQLSVPAGAPGAPHRPSREEVLLVLDGTLSATVDDDLALLGPGDVLHVPAGSMLTIDGGPEGARAWVTTTAGLEATTAQGQVLRPPWAQ